MNKVAQLMEVISNFKNNYFRIILLVMLQLKSLLFKKVNSF